MVEFACACLRDAGHEPILAWYEPYSLSPGLSAPLWRLPFQRPGERRESSYGCEGHAIGAWLPELEFTHYRPTRLWRELMRTCESYLAVSGNCLAAAPFALTGKPFLAWVATPWEEDRKARVAAFPPLRRMLDRMIVRAMMPQVERKILRSGCVLALSGYTGRALEARGGSKVFGVLPMPIDTAAFVPAPRSVVAGRVGFTGRMDDPRKNVKLLLTAVKRARDSGLEITAVLVGVENDSGLTAAVREQGLEGSVQLFPYLPHERLIPLLQTLDLFVIPSHQEGLCISALEAMACGCPVVSTRCGGPEEFVQHGVTGYLVGFAAEEMARSIAAVVRDRRLRGELSAAARKLAAAEYGCETARLQFQRVFAESKHFPRGGHP
jgi:glycosyltransferase involved in cell wall biosynthesis